MGFQGSKVSRVRKEISLWRILKVRLTNRQSNRIDGLFNNTEVLFSMSTHLVHTYVGIFDKRNFFAAVRLFIRSFGHQNQVHVDEASVHFELIC